MVWDCYHIVLLILAGNEKRIEINAARKMCVDTLQAHTTH